MSDALELMLKQAVKKIVAEALTETMQEQVAGGALALRPRVIAPAVATARTRQKSLIHKQFMIIVKSFTGVALALTACGVIVAGLFAPELAHAVVNRGLDYSAQYEAQFVVQNDPPYELPYETDCQWHPQQHPRRVNVSWQDLANMDKVEEMIRQGAILHASPEDLVAIFLFHQIRKVMKGDRIELNQLENDFKESLPCHWMPAYQAIKEEFPTQQQFPPMPTDWFPAVRFK